MPTSQQDFYTAQRERDEKAAAGGDIGAARELDQIGKKLGNTDIGRQDRMFAESAMLSRGAPGGSSTGSRASASATPPGAVAPSGNEPGWEKTLVGTEPENREWVENPQKKMAEVMNDPAVIALTTILGARTGEAGFMKNPEGALGGAGKSGSLMRGVTSRAKQAQMEAYAPLFKAIEAKTGPIAERISQVAREMGMPVQQVAKQAQTAMREMASHITGKLHDAADEVASTVKAGKETTREGFRETKASVKAQRAASRATKAVTKPARQQAPNWKAPSSTPKGEPAMASKQRGPNWKPSKSAETPHETKTATPKGGETKTAPKPRTAKKAATEKPTAAPAKEAAKAPTGDNKEAWAAAGRKAPPKGVSPKAWEGKTRRERYNLLKNKGK